MIDDFFQKQITRSARPSHFAWNLLCRILFYTSLAGFIFGILFGYLHMKGWVPNAEEGLVLYGITFGVGALLSTSFVLYQLRHNRQKAEKIRVHQNDKI